MGWEHADEQQSAYATSLLGRTCYVVRGRYPADRILKRDEPALMIADGVHRFVCVSTADEIPAGVAELKAGIND